MKIEGSRPNLFPACQTCPVAREAIESFKEPNLISGGTLKNLELTNTLTGATITIPFTDLDVSYSIQCVYKRTLASLFRERLIMEVEMSLDPKHRNSNFPSPLATFDGSNDVTNDCPGINKTETKQ